MTTEQSGEKCLPGCVTTRGRGGDIKSHAPDCPTHQPAPARIEHRDVCHETYPCEDCGKTRTKAEGGTTFTVCDECWDKRLEPAPVPVEPDFAASVDWNRVDGFVAQPVDSDPDVSWTPAMLEQVARAIKALKAENAMLRGRVEYLESLFADYADDESGPARTVVEGWAQNEGRAILARRAALLAKGGK